MTESQGYIVLADGDTAVRQALAAMLRHQGFEVAEAATGDEALALARDRAPDAVLADAHLPGASGFEVCVKLKSQPPTATTPVLIASSAADREDRQRGEDAGAADYVVKPIDMQDVAGRLRSAIRLRALNRQVEESAARIKDLESSRDELTQMIVRDMKSPLAGLAGLLELADRAAVKHLSKEASFYLNEALGATETLEEMVDSLMDVRRIAAGERTLALRPCDLRAVAGGCADLLGDAAKAAGVAIVIGGTSTPVSCDENLIRRVLLHLLRQALRRSARGQTVDLGLTVADDRAVITVTDHGRDLGENETALVRQWLRGERGGGEEGGPGRLGYTFCRLVVQAHGGAIELESGAGATTVKVRLPVGSLAPGDAPASAPEAPEVAEGERRSRRYIAGRQGEPQGERTAVLSLSTLGTRARFAVAVSLMSVLPLLSFMYLVIAGLRHDSVHDVAFYTVTPVVVALVILGIVLLRRHSRQVERLRLYLEVMARGGAPQLAFSDGGEDFEAIEKSLGAVIRQTDDRIRTIEEQSRALVQAEQQRVMVETLGAACHHLGQPATVIRVYLEMMQKKEPSPEMQRMIAECRDAAESVTDILQRLQGVAKYQTEPYLSSQDSEGPGREGRILKI